MYIREAESAAAARTELVRLNRPLTSDELAGQAFVAQPRSAGAHALEQAAYAPAIDLWNSRTAAPDPDLDRDSSNFEPVEFTRDPETHNDETPEQEVM